MDRMELRVRSDEEGSDKPRERRYSVALDGAASYSVCARSKRSVALRRALACVADDAPPVAWGASRPAFDESDDDDDDMWWPAPAKAPRPRSVRFADTVTETPAGDDSEDRAVDAFRSFLTAFDGERARQRKGLEACAARTLSLIHI